ncbi:Vitamin B6 transporter [Xanthoria parietina]
MMRAPRVDVERQGHTEDKQIGDPHILAQTDTDTTDDSAHSSLQHDIPPTPVLLQGRLARWNDKIEGLAGLEARGITRVTSDEKHAAGIRQYLQMVALWFSMNLTSANIITGLLGRLLFSLGWIDAVCIAIFATGLAACSVSYVSTFGPASGNRTMILGRYFMGYWPSKLACILNIILQIGWGIIGCIIAGQMFSAINGKGLTIAVGCVIAALLIGCIATFGIAYVHLVERYAWIPQLLAILVLVGKSAPHYNTSATFIGEPGTLTASRCSFFALIFASVIGFSAVSADFYVYYPTTTPARLTFSLTWTGIWVGAMFCNIVGIAIATGVESNPTWESAYSISSGALLLECYSGLGGFGSFCLVILALTSVTNNAPCTYAGALTIQVLGRYAKAVPRWVWCVIITLVELICSVAGRNHLYNIFENFLPIMSYWVVPWVTIVVEEHLIFHKLRGVPFDWSAWEDKRRLPIGGAALVAWLVGWAGAIIGMSQVWYTGPVAMKVGGHGGDIGAWLAIAFAGSVFPPLRYWELKVVGR